MPTLRAPFRGSLVITAGNVMKGAASPGQQVWTGKRRRSTSSPVRTTSCTGPRRVVCGRESAIDFSFLSPRTLSTSPCGGCISSTSSSFAATSSSRSTPRARHIRRSVPNWLIKRGWLAPFGRSNSSAGPPALTVRSTISVTSRCGSTSAETRTSSPSRSSSAIQERRSAGGAKARSVYVGQRQLNRVCERQRTAGAVAALELRQVGDDVARELVALGLPLAHTPAGRVRVRRPQKPSGALGVSLGRRDPGEEGQSEDHSLAVADPAGDQQALASTRACVVDPTETKRALGRMLERSLLPPDEMDLGRELGAAVEERKRVLEAALVERDRAEQARRLRLGEVPRIERETLVGKRARSPAIADPIRLDPESDQHVRDPKIVAERPVLLERLLRMARPLLEVSDDVDATGEHAHGPDVELPRYLLRARQELCHTSLSLQRSVRHPVLLEQHGQPHGRLQVPRRHEPVERGAEIRLLGVDERIAAVAPPALDTFDGKVGLLRHRQEEAGVRVPQRVLLAGVTQALERELADRLEHPEPALFADADEALVDERLKAVEVGFADGLGRLERATICEHREPSEQPLLVLLQQVVRPFDRRSQRLLPNLGVPAAAEQVEPATEPLEQLTGREHRDPRRGELERKRQVVQPRAQLVERRLGLEVGTHGPGAGSEQLARIATREDRHRVDMLARELEPLAARDDDGEIRTRADDR